MWERASRYVLQADEGWTGRPDSDVPGDRFLVAGAETDNRLAIVEHPIEQGWFAAPHTHSREDEYSFVVEGEFGFEIGETVFSAGRGALVFKPRNVRHAFWNKGSGRGLILEIVSPAGLERFFEEATTKFEGRLPPPEAMCRSRRATESPCTPKQFPSSSKGTAWRRPTQPLRNERCR